jgi:flagellar basal body-associated protein FliL
VVNLVDPGNVRYVNCKIEVEVEDKELAALLTDRQAQLKDAAISLLGARTYEELAGLEGKTRLREELTARFNRLLPTGQVARIYFTEFVIQ